MCEAGEQRRTAQPRGGHCKSGAQFPLIYRSSSPGRFSDLSMSVLAYSISPLLVGLVEVGLVGARPKVCQRTCPFCKSGEHLHPTLSIPSHTSRPSWGSRQSYVWRSHNVISRRSRGEDTDSELSTRSPAGLHCTSQAQETAMLPAATTLGGVDCRSRPSA